MVKCRECANLCRILEIKEYQPFKDLPIDREINVKGSLLDIEYECFEDHDLDEGEKAKGECGYTQFTLKVDEERECRDYKTVEPLVNRLAKAQEPQKT